MDRETELEIHELHARICKAIADPKRLLIINELRNGPLTVGELSDALRDQPVELQPAPGDPARPRGRRRPSATGPASATSCAATRWCRRSTCCASSWPRSSAPAAGWAGRRRGCLRHAADADPHAVLVKREPLERRRARVTARQPHRPGLRLAHHREEDRRALVTFVGVRVDTDVLALRGVIGQQRGHALHRDGRRLRQRLRPRQPRPTSR